MVWHNFHFLRPWWLLAFIPAVIIFILYLRRSNTNSNNWQDHCDPHLLPYLIIGEQKQTSSALPYWLLTSWLLLILALAGPTWQQYAQPTYQQNTARVIALDVSTSMNSSDLVPSRLERAKYKVLDLLKELNEGQTAMLVFSSSPFVVSPLTNDSNTIASMVPVIDSSIVPVQGVDIGKALQKSADLLKQTGFNKGQIILITDSSPSASDKQIAVQLAHDGYNLSVLAIGTARGAPVSNASGGFATDSNGNVTLARLDKSALQDLAHSGNGNYIEFSNDDNDVQTITKIINDNSMIKDPSAKSEVKNLWQDEGHWLIWLAIVFILIIARKGWLDKLC